MFVQQPILVVVECENYRILLFTYVVGVCILLMQDINVVALSPNDQMLATGSQDKTIRLWNAADLAAVATLKGHKRGVWKVLFSPVDKVLISCSGDRTLRLWSMVDFCSLRVFEGHTASVLCARFVNNGSQIVSCSADGLMRLWSVRTGECVNTFDEHQDKVWALAYLESSAAATSAATGDESSLAAHTAGDKGSSSSSVRLITAGSDARLLVWRDCTAEDERIRLDKLEKTVLLEQQLSSDLHHRRYGRALSVALSLGHSLKVLQILTAIIEDDSAEAQVAMKTISHGGCDLRQSLLLDQYIAPLEDEDLEKIIGYLSDWNTNSRYSFPSQMLISCLFRVIPSERLRNLRLLTEKCAGLQAYSERHYSRVDKLYQATHLIDYIISSITMQQLDSASGAMTDDYHHRGGGALRDSSSIATTGGGGGSVALHSDDDDDGLVIFKKQALSDRKKGANVGSDQKKKRKLNTAATATGHSQAHS